MREITRGSGRLEAQTIARAYKVGVPERDVKANAGTERINVANYVSANAQQITAHGLIALLGIAIIAMVWAYIESHK